MECYDLAVSDSNEVLQLEPDNIKALYRRARANEKLSEFSKVGLFDILYMYTKNRLTFFKLIDLWKNNIVCCIT